MPVKKVKKKDGSIGYKCRAIEAAKKRRRRK